MLDIALEMYRQMVTNLRRGNTGGVFSIAKPVFMLTLIEYVPFLLDNSLKWGDHNFEASYTSNFLQYSDLTPTPIWKPFFYLSSEAFYYLDWKDGFSKNLIKRPSSKVLREYLHCARVDEAFWILLQDPQKREYIKQSILEHYHLKERK